MCVCVCLSLSVSLFLVNPRRTPRADAPRGHYQCRSWSSSADFVEASCRISFSATVFNKRCVTFFFLLFPKKSGEVKQKTKPTGSAAAPVRRVAVAECQRAKAPLHPFQMVKSSSTFPLVANTLFSCVIFLRAGKQRWYSASYAQ